LKTGPLNAITDVAGVVVGQVTIWEGDGVRTGVTAILPHGGNLFQEKVPGAIHLGNAFGKLVGYTQVQELGFIETPIVLTNTLSVWEAANAVVTHLLALPGNEDVRQAAIEATEEAVYNSMLKAVDVVGRDGNRVEALPIDRLLEIGKKFNRLHAKASGR
jgi:D-aminopeptidase